MSAKKRRKIKLGRRIMESLELPEELLSGEPRITMVGMEHALIENHKGIFEFGEDYVRLNTSSGMLRVRGSALTLRELSSQRLYISGDIRALEYE